MGMFEITPWFAMDPDMAYRQALRRAAEICFTRAAEHMPTIEHGDTDRDAGLMARAVLNAGNEIARCAGIPERYWDEDGDGTLKPVPVQQPPMSTDL